MISYPVSDADLDAGIDVFDPTWRAKAKAATAACRAAGRYVKEDAAGKTIEGLWGDIKDELTARQNGKCCYCERLLESRAFGRVEHDVEHFRPKSTVKNWFTAEVKSDFPDWPATLHMGGDSAKGYFLLPFDARNYATSCKTCNSALKRDYFPIAGTARLTAVSPKAARLEKPFLIFPVGEWDERAESLIEFEGITARPVHDATADLLRHWRARVTIRFFRLNHGGTGPAPVSGGEGRENLYRERAEAISALAFALDALETATTAAKRKTCENKIKRCISAKSSHTNCCQSFLRRWSDPARRATAVEIWQGVEDYLNSQG